MARPDPSLEPTGCDGAAGLERLAVRWTCRGRPAALNRPAAGGKYLARGGAHKVYEGDWMPRRIVLFEFPSVEAFESFYRGPVVQSLRPLRDACSSARLVSVEGLA